MFINDSNIGSKVGLDEKFFMEYDRQAQPSDVFATDELFFRQKTESDSGFIQNAEFAGPGDFRRVARGEEVPVGNVRIGNKQTLEINEFDQDIDFAQADLEDTEQYDIKQDAVQEMGVAAQTSRDKFTFEETYGNLEDATNNPTPDGAAVASNSHVSLSGATVDNLETGVLSTDNLKVLVRRLRLMPRQGGGLGSYHFDGLLVALNLLETAKEITDSELKPGTGNNNINWVSNLYPGVRLGTSEYLHSDYNSLSANINTTYSAVSRRHKVTHCTRVALATEWIPAEISRTRTAYYRARFRERAYPGTWSGIAVANGTV